MSINWKKNDSYLKGLPLSIILFLCFLIFLSIGILDLTKTTNQESKEILQEAVQRATVQCYAIEGMYPPDVKYLEENYGVVIDHDKYAVHYEVFAANILPDIKVIDLRE